MSVDESTEMANLAFAIVTFIGAGLIARLVAGAIPVDGYPETGLGLAVFVVVILGSLILYDRVQWPR